MDVAFILREAHSGIRWLVVLVGVILLLRSLYAWLAAKPAAGYDRGLVSGFSSLLGLQFLLGLILFIVLGQWAAYQWAHLVIMFFAVFLAGLCSRWRRLPDGPRFRNTTLTLIGVAVLIYFGVAALPYPAWQF